MAGGEQFDASTNRRGRRATYPAVCGKRATLSGNADRAKQKAAVRAERTNGWNVKWPSIRAGGNTTPEDIGSMGGDTGRSEGATAEKAVPFPGAVRRSLVVLRFAALDPFTRRGFLRLFLPMLDDF